MANYMFDVIDHIRENLPRLEDVFASEGTETQEAYSDEDIMNHAFWLNDLLFICPPQSINTQTDQLVAKYQALRSVASSKVPYGKATKYFMIDLVIPAKSGIMNVDYRLPDNNAVAPISNDSDYVNTGKRGGILDLIIQFKVTPFARVENAFIRSTLGISKDKNMAMCLHQLTLYTIKGRKGAVGCKLLMSVFNYSPYSPNFLYKEDWVTKNKYGRFNIEGVNRIDFSDPGVANRRVPYKIYIQGVQQGFQTLGGEPEEPTAPPEQEAEDAVSPLSQLAPPVGGANASFSRESRVTNEQRSRAFEEQYNMLFTENEDEMSSVDSYFMDTPRAVQNPATSAVFKAYIDWVHSRWTSINDLDGEFNGSLISQYGTQEQDLGDQVVIEWKEFKTEPMPPEVQQEIQIWYRQRMADYQAARGERDDYEQQSPERPQRTPEGPIPPGPQSSSPSQSTEGLEVVTNPSHQDWPQQSTNILQPYRVIYDPTQTRRTGHFGSWRERRRRNHKGIDIHSQSVGRTGYELMAIYGGELRYQLSKKDPILTNEIARKIIYFKENLLGVSESGSEIWEEISPGVYRYDDLRFALNGFVEYEDRGEAGVFLKRQRSWHPVEQLIQSSYGLERVYNFTYQKTLQTPSGGVTARIILNDSRYENTELYGKSFHYMHIAATDRLKDQISNNSIDDITGSTEYRAGSVEPGDLIGYGGCTGINDAVQSDAHLHFEIAKNNRLWGTGVSITEYLDPTPFIHFGQRSSVTSADSGSLGIIAEGPYYLQEIDTNSWTQSEPPGYISPRDPVPTEEETERQNQPLGQDQAERERRQAENYNTEALNSLEKYRQFVENQEIQGWKVFRENTLAFNIFYRIKRISIPASDQENYPLGVPIVCDFISGGASNIIATIPMMGQTYPTAQFLGRRDDEFMLSFRAVGLNNVKLLSRMRDELKSQAHFYKWIPNAWMVKIENKFINAFGHRYFVINNMSEVTSPGQPNTYNIEIGITSHPANTDQGQITSMQVTNKEEIKLAFWEELLYGYANGEDDTRKLLIQKQVSWKLTSNDLTNGTTVKPYLSEAGDELDLSLEQRNLFLANPDLLARRQNTNQPEASPGDPNNAFGDPNQELFNWLNTKVASTLNLIRVIISSFLRSSDFNGIKYKTLIDRIYFKDLGIYNILKQIPLGAGYIVAETSLATEKNNRTVVGSPEQGRIIQLANEASGYANWFTERQGLHRWSQPEKNWSFSDNVARREDMRLLDASMEVTGVEGSIDGLLGEAYNYSANVHTNHLITGIYTDGSPVPVMEAYLDVRPSIRAGTFLDWITDTHEHSWNFLDRNKADIDSSTVEYFASLFTRVLRAGFNYPSIIINRPVITGRVATVRANFPYFDTTTGPGGGAGMAYQDYALPLPVGQEESVGFEFQEPKNTSFLSDLIKPPFQPSFSRNVSRRLGLVGIFEELQTLPDIRSAGFHPQLRYPYLWDQLAIPYLNNAFSMEDIIRYSQFTWQDGTPIFPRTTELLKRQKIGAEGSAYPDMMLPLHPFWSSQNSVLPVSSIYTEPDFYLVNYGIDTNTESSHLEPISDGIVRTAENATNHFIQVQSELAVQSLDMMEGRARDASNQLIDQVDHTTVDGIVVPKSKPFIEMVNPISRNALGTFQGDSVYLRSDHSMGSGYASGNVNPNTGTRTKEYSEVVRIQALDSGAPNITKTRSADASADTVIGQKINQSPIDTRLDEAAMRYFQGPSNEDQFSYESKPQGSDVQLNAGMRVLQDRQLEDPTKVLWRNVVPLFAPNVAFPETPLSFNGETFVGMGFDGYSRHSSASVIESINNNNDSAYRFNVESSGSDPTAFVNGNWGYSDIHQFTTSRLSTYEKIRDGLKGLNIKKWAFRRAFPTFKVYIIEEDEVEREWVQYDDFYQYNQIQEIQISESRKRPASVCMINFINIGGALDGNNQWHYWARNNPAEEYNSLNPRRSREQAARDRRYDSDTSNSLLAGTAEEQNISRFLLNPGVKIKVKLGYSNNPTKMEDVFLGSIAEIVPDADAGSVVIIAQGYGAELVEKPKGGSKEEIATTYFTTFDVLASLMFSSEVKHFGKKKINSISMIGTDQSLVQNELIYRNTVAQTTSALLRKAFGVVWRVSAAIVTLGASEATIAMVGLANDLVYEVDRQLKQVRVGPEDGPQDDNIYAPNYSVAQLNYHWWNPVNITNGRWRQAPASPALETMPLELDIEDGGSTTTYDPGPGGVPMDMREVVTRRADPNFAYYEQMSPGELEYNVFYSSIWDIFQEMTLRHPGFVKHPKIYKNSNRMTMFFGLPDQKYWAAEPSVGEITQANATFSAMRNGIQMVPVSGPVVNRRSGPITNRNPAGNSTVANGYESRTGASTGEGDAPGELAVDIDLLSNWMSIVQRRLKPFRNWYSINSATDIIENRIEANKLGFYTSVSLQYLSGASASKLKGALKKLQKGGSPDAELITPSNFIAWSDREVEHTQAHRDMSPDEIRQKFHQFANCRSRSMARRYARALLAGYAKEMYKGSISMLGNSKIKPYDVLLINDTHHNVQGPIEVEEVIHNFNPMTGFTTEVIPDTFIIQEDRTAFVMYNSLWAHAGLKTSRHMEGILFQRDSTLPDSNAFNIIADNYRRSIEFERENLESLNEMVEDLRYGRFSETGGGVTLVQLGLGGVATAFVVGSLGAGLLGAGAIALGAAMWSGLMSNFVTSVYVNYVHNNRAYFMIPLMRNNTPWTVGYNITGTNSFAMGIFDVIRRWWQDGGEGVTLSNIDAALAEQRIGLSLSSQLNTFSSLSLGWDQFSRSFRTGLTLGGSQNIQSGIR